MTIVLVPVGRGNWKTRLELVYSGPSAPGPMSFYVGQHLELPIMGYEIRIKWRIVEILP